MAQIRDGLTRLVPSLVQALGALLFAWGLWHLSHWLGLVVGGLLGLIAGIAMEARREGSGVMVGSSEPD
jgi:hypothetical protein